MSSFSIPGFDLEAFVAATLAEDLGEGLPALSGYGLTELRHRLHLKHVEYSPLGDDMVLTGRL